MPPFFLCHILTNHSNMIGAKPTERRTLLEEAAGIRFDREVRKARTVDDEGRLLPGISGWKKDFEEGASIAPADPTYADTNALMGYMITHGQ